MNSHRTLPRARRLAALVLAAVVVLVGCGVDGTAGGRHMAGRPMDGRDTPATSGQGAGQWMAGQWMAGRRGMHGMMGVRDEADFLLLMIPHHREAIVAAQSLSRSSRPELRRLGRSIRASQSEQVATMEAWVARWYPQAEPSTAYRPMMSDLSALDGDDLDRTFLIEMIHHHMMAVMMSRHLLAAGQVRHPAVADLAGTIIDEQTAEIVLMRQWLHDLT